jgi:hypothetical protein
MLNIRTERKGNMVGIYTFCENVIIIIIIIITIGDHSALRVQLRSYLNRKVAAPV